MGYSWSVELLGRELELGLVAALGSGFVASQLRTGATAPTAQDSAAAVAASAEPLGLGLALAVDRMRD